MSNEGLPVPSRTPDRERWAGTIFAFLSMFFYGISNVAIRYLTQYDIDSNWLILFREFTGLTVLMPWLLFRWFQGRFLHCSRRVAVIIFIAAILCEFIGARFQILGYAVIGLIIAVPLIQSSTLLGVAILSSYVFGEPLSRRRKISIAILIVAAAILGIGKELTVAGHSSANDAVDAGQFLLVAGGTIVAGIAFAIYIVLLRYSIRQHWKDENSAWLSFKFRHWIGYDYARQSKPRFYSPFPVTLSMSIVYGVGVMIYATSLYCQQGTAAFFNVPSFAWQGIVIAGVANTIGFFFQVQGLRLTSAVQASLIGVCQMVVLSLIGYLWFAEAVSMLVMMGLGLTIYGVFVSAKPEK